jgi:uncharacterized protein
MFIRGLIRLLYYAVVAYLIYSIYRFFKNLGRPRVSTQERARLSGVMVKDESCQTYLPKADAIRDVIDSQEHFFCSQECRRKFLDERRQRSRG